MTARPLTIIHLISSLGPAGAENVLYRLVTAESEHRHIVVSLNVEEIVGKRLREAGYTVHSLGFHHRTLYLKGLLKLWRIIRTTRPDVLQTWMYHANLLGGVLGRLAGVPFICWNIRRTSLEPALTSLRTRAIAKICAWISRRVPDRIVYCARSAAESHVKFGYDPARSVVIHNGIDSGRFAPDPLARAQQRQQMTLASGQPLLGYVARFHPHKDHESLFQALRIVRDRGARLACVLVGPFTAPGNAQIAALAAKCGVGDQLICLGNRDDLPAVINALDVHVSASATEGFPNALAEAQACGVPSVATDVGESAHIVGEWGWVVPRRDAARLAAAIETAVGQLGSPEWEAMSRGARQRIIDEFGLEAMVAAYHRLWAIGARPNTAS